MILYPAIDLIGGAVVRLHKGDFDQLTEYGTDPVAVARSYACLLYTSPSPRDRQKSRMPSSA